MAQFMSYKQGAKTQRTAMWMTGGWINSETNGVYDVFAVISGCLHWLLQLFFINNVLIQPHFLWGSQTKENARRMYALTSSITISSLSVSARSWECSAMTCKALVIKFSVSSVLPEDSLSTALRRGKQKEKAGADRGAMSKERQTIQKNKRAVGGSQHWLKTLIEVVATTLTVCDVSSFIALPSSVLIYNAENNRNKEKTFNEKAFLNFWLVVFVLKYYEFDISWRPMTETLRISGKIGAFSM